MADKSNKCIKPGYEGLALPKRTRRKKKQKHKESILPGMKGICFLCSLKDDNYSWQYTEEHHVFFGSGLRKVSEEKGFKVDLCKKHHGESKEGVHGSRAVRISLCKIFQEEYEKTHTHEEWMEIVGKNYL